MMLCQMTLGYVKQLLTTALKWVSTAEQEEGSLGYGDPFKDLLIIHACFCVWLFTTLWTVAHQAPLSKGFSRPEYWTGLPGKPSWYWQQSITGSFLMNVLGWKKLKCIWKRNKLCKKDITLQLWIEITIVLSSQKCYSAHISPFLFPNYTSVCWCYSGLKAFPAAAMSCQASPYPPENINTYASVCGGYAS